MALTARKLVARTFARPIQTVVVSRNDRDRLARIGERTAKLIDLAQVLDARDELAQLSQLDADWHAAQDKFCALMGVE